MLLTALVSWWYSVGWVKQAESVSEQLARALDTFSIALLIKTLFSPFRQISANSVRGPLSVRFRAWGDRLISRFVGAGVRTIIILIGLVYIALLLLFGLVRLVVWPLILPLPIIAVALLYMGGIV